MSTINEKMTALADEVRELSGVTTPLSIDNMTTEVSDANAEISEQMDLIAQISTALEGKASGGSGGSIETCTVTIRSNMSCDIYGTEYIDGEIGRIDEICRQNSSITISNVVKNSTLVACISDASAASKKYYLDDYSIDNMEVINDSAQWVVLRVWDWGNTNDCSCELTWTGSY